jgi:hypothetical protein
VQASLTESRPLGGARIVNISSGLGSLTQNSDPGYRYEVEARVEVPLAEAPISVRV